MGGEEDAKGGLGAPTEETAPETQDVRRLSQRISLGGARYVRQFPGAAGSDPMERPRIILGIDLGTARCRVARISNDGRPVIIHSAPGETAIPSVVYFEAEGTVMVGRAAEELHHPELVARQFKRALGTEAEYVFHGQRHSPESLSALIFCELARLAEEDTGQTAWEAVIAVPPYFGTDEREAVLQAGHIAGLNVLELIDEPVAAVLHYNAMPDVAHGPQHVLVYDLGGTFDASVLRLDNGTVSVVSTDGHHGLGGADWDAVIAERMLGQFRAEHPQDWPDDSEGFMRHLLSSAERMKEKLTVTQSWRCSLRFEGAATQAELTRQRMEELTEHLLAHTADITHRVIAEAQSTGSGDLDAILLAGAMTRMPAVSRMLKDLTGLDPQCSKPDLAVAQGAALRAVKLAPRIKRSKTTAPARTAQRASPKTRPGTSQAEPQGAQPSGVRVTTVMPRAIGVKSLDRHDPLALTDPQHARQIIVPLLPANTPLPANTGPLTFHTTIANQRMVSIEVWEQTGDTASEDLDCNRIIATGILRNLPPRLPAHAPVQVIIFVSEAGLLTAQVKEPTSASLKFDLLNAPEAGDLGTGQHETDAIAGGRGNTTLTRR